MNYENMAEEKQKIKKPKNRKANKFSVGRALSVVAIIIAVPVIIFTPQILLGALVLGVTGLAFTIGLSVINKKKEAQKIKSDLNLDLSERMISDFKKIEEKMNLPLAIFFENVVLKKKKQEQEKVKYFGENFADVDAPEKSDRQEIFNPAEYKKISNDLGAPEESEIKKVNLSEQKKNGNYTENTENTSLDSSESMISDFEEIEEKMKLPLAIFFENLLLKNEQEQEQEKDKYFGVNFADVDAPEKSVRQEIFNPAEYKKISNDLGAPKESEIKKKVNLSEQIKNENYTENRNLDSSESMISDFKEIEEMNSSLANFFENLFLKKEQEQEKDKYFGENFADVDAPEKSERQEIFNPAEYKKISNDLGAPEESEIKKKVNLSEQKKNQNYTENRENTSLDLSERMISDFDKIEKMSLPLANFFEDVVLKMGAFTSPMNAERKSNTAGKRKTTPSKKQYDEKRGKNRGLRNG